MKIKTGYVIRAPIIMFVLICAVLFFKPTVAEAHNNGCNIVSPSTMEYHQNDAPNYSSDGTWDEWVNWYQGKGYTYTGYSQADGGSWWLNLSKDGTAYYAFLMTNSAGKYWAPYNRWIYVNGAYYYTNKSAIVLRNTWALIRINDDYYSTTDPYGYFAFDNSGAMCTGWHKANDENWYYFRIDHANNKDGACIKVGESSGFCWSENKKPPNSNSESRGIYHFTGINVTTNVYIMGTDGSYPTKIPDTDKKLDFIKVDDIQPLSGVKTYKPNADFVKGKYEKIEYLSLNTEKSASLEATKNINIVNGDYTEYSIEAFNYYVDRNKYKQTVQVRYQKADGNWGDYSNAIYADYYYGAKVSWSREADDTYNAASIKYTVTEAATKKVDVKRKQYTQTINFNTYGASGTYNKPTYKTTYLNKKTYNSYYGSTFNAKSHGADYGNVEGYHWWKIDKNSWTVTGTGATNSFYYSNKYRLNVDVAGGSGTNGNFDMEYGTSINLGTPTRTGWKFTGWTKIYDNSTNSTLSGNQFVMGYSNTYPYQDYMTEPSVKIIANWQDVTAPNASDTILTATNPAKTTVYATVTGKSPVAETPWVNNNVLLTFSSRDYESGLSELGIFEKIT